MNQEIVHYQDPQSRAVRTQMILDVFQIPHRNVLVDLRKGDHKQADYAAVHPYRRVPALEHDGRTLVESGAITLYLAELFPEKLHTPAAGTPERARFYEWMFFLHATLEPCAMEFYAAGNDEAGKDKARQKIRELLEAMQAKFQGPFVLGETFGVLDVVLLTELFWYTMIGAYRGGIPLYDQYMADNKTRLPQPNQG